MAASPVITPPPTNALANSACRPWASHTGGCALELTAQVRMPECSNCKTWYELPTYLKDTIFFFRQNTKPLCLF